MKNKITKVEFEAYKEVAEIQIKISRRGRQIKTYYSDLYGNAGAVTEYHAILFINEKIIQIRNDKLPNEIQSIEFLILKSNGKKLLRIEYMETECVYMTDLSGRLSQTPFMVGWFYIADSKMVFSEIYFSEYQGKGCSSLFYSCDDVNNGNVELIEQLITTFYYEEGSR